MDHKVKPGIYRHYRGNFYRVHFVGRHSESLDETVVYETLYENDLSKFWVRPLKDFVNEVEYEGKIVPHYEYIGETIDLTKEVIKKEIGNTVTEENMSALVKLMSILQLTKEMPLTGYLPAGIKLSETATLAEHHYTASLNAFLLGQKIVRAGGIIDTVKLVQMTMVHDLGELFGGDIAGPLNRKYPDLREYKDKIAERAIDLLSSYLGEEKNKFKELYDEFEHGTTDEAIVGKLMDQMDHQFFLEHNNCHLKYFSGDEDYRDKFTENHVFALVDKIRDPISKEVAKKLVDAFRKDFYKKGYKSVSLLME